MLGASLGLMACLVVQAEPSREPGGSAKDESLEQVIQREDPVRWELGVRVESRTGRPQSSDASAHLTEVEVDPLAALRVPFRPGEFTISYEPRLVIIAHQTPVEPTQRAYYLNRGRLVLDIRPDEKWRVFVNARAAYGEYDFSPLSGPATSTSGTGAPPTTPGTPGPPTPNPGPSTLPEDRFVLAIDLDGSAGMVHFFNPSVGYLLSAGYTYSGGADAAAREQLPLQQGPKASTGVLWTRQPPGQPVLPPRRIPQSLQQRPHRHGGRPHHHLDPDLEPYASPPSSSVASGRSIPRPRPPPAPLPTRKIRYFR